MLCRKFEQISVKIGFLKLLQNLVKDPYSLFYPKLLGENPPFSSHFLMYMHVFSRSMHQVCQICFKKDYGLYNTSSPQ